MTTILKSYKPIFLLSTFGMHAMDRFSQWLRPYGTVYRPHIDCLAATDLAFSTPAHVAGALYEEVRHHQVQGVFDLSSSLAQSGFSDYFAAKHPTIPVWSPGLRGVALETWRSNGQEVITRAMENIEFPSARTPKIVAPNRATLLDRPELRDGIAALYELLGPSVVLKQETGMDMLRVRFAHSLAQFEYLLEEMRYPLQVQSFVKGIEIAFYAVVVGADAEIVPLCTLFEHKRAMSGNLGALTHEMGTVVVAGLSETARRVFEAHRPQLRERGYTGLLEINTMFDPVTEQWVFLEYTCRHSDPGFDILLSMCDGEKMGETLMQWLHGHPAPLPMAQTSGVGVVVAGGGYPHPDGAIQGLPITFDIPSSHLDPSMQARMPMAVQITEDGNWVTRGGRHVLCVGKSTGGVALARSRAYHLAEGTRFFGRMYRTDIGEWWGDRRDLLSDYDLLPVGTI